MTTLAHEINQPLNALSMYLFTARRAIEQTQIEQACMMLGKAEGGLVALTPLSVHYGSLPGAPNWKYHSMPLI